MRVFTLALLFIIIWLKIRFRFEVANTNEKNHTLAFCASASAGACNECAAACWKFNRLEKSRLFRIQTYNDQFACICTKPWIAHTFLLLLCLCMDLLVFLLFLSHFSDLIYTLCNNIDNVRDFSMVFNSNNENPHQLNHVAVCLNACIAYSTVEIPQDTRYTYKYCHIIIIIQCWN